KLAASKSTRLAGNVLGAPLREVITEGFEYSDCWVEDSRLVVINAMDAREHGAAILTRSRVVQARPALGGWSVMLQGRDEPAPRTVHTRMMVNATGAWVNDVLQRC